MENIRYEITFIRIILLKEIADFFLSSHLRKRFINWNQIQVLGLS